MLIVASSCLACWNYCWSCSGGFAGQCRGVIGHSDRGADNWNNEFKIVFLDDDLCRANIHSETFVKNVYIVCGQVGENGLGLLIKTSVDNHFLYVVLFRCLVKD